MIVRHQNRTPEIHESAVIAPGAIISGDVAIGPQTCVLSGAVITSQGGPVRIASHCVVMENAVVRGVPPDGTSIGNHTLIGPHAHITGCTIGDECFVATGASVFNGATLANRCVVRINSVVHINAKLPAGTQTPIGWIAIGDPAQLFPPVADDEYLAELKAQGFWRSTFQSDADTPQREKLEAYTRALSRHRDDAIVDD